MRIIITGGTGMIGRELTNRLLTTGHEVIILTRNPQKNVGLPAGAQLVQWDARTADGWGHLADGADAIINLAGENLAGAGFIPSRWTAERKQRILDSRVNAGKAVTEAVRAATHKPAVVIQASGTDYYPNGGQHQTETSPIGSSFLSDVVKQWEASTAAVEEMGVRRVIMRIGPILSMEDGAFTRLVFPFKYLIVGGPLGGGQQHFPWVHHTDVVRAIEFFLTHPETSGPYNIVATEADTNGTFTKTLGKIMGRPSFFPVPGFALQLALGEVAALVLEGRQVSSQKLRAAGFEFDYPTAESAIRELLGKK